MAIRIADYSELCEHQLGDSCSNIAACMARNGWELHFKTGSDLVGIQLSSLKKREEGESDFTYVILLEDISSLSMPIVCSDTLSFLDLFSRLSAMVRDTSITEAIVKLFDGDTLDEWGFIEQIAGKIRFGLDEGYLQLVRDTADRKQQWARERLAKKESREGKGKG